jgi:hypothetical protein
MENGLILRPNLSDLTKGAPRVVHFHDIRTIVITTILYKVREKSAFSDSCSCLGI